MIYSLDIETRPIDPRLNHCAALEPWRVRQGKAEISSIAICLPDDTTRQIINNKQSTWRQEVYDFLKVLEGKTVYAHNAGFDIAWLIGTLEPNKFKSVPSVISNIHWRDTMLLVKWCINGQRPEAIQFSYALVNLIATFLPNHPLTEEFKIIKSQKVAAGQDEAYWRERGLYDVILTKALAELLQAKLPEEQRVGLMTEFACLVPVANSWMNGLKIDVNRIEQVGSEIESIMAEAAGALGVAGTLLNSPKQLGNMLFNEWGLPPWSRGKTGPSTAKGDLMWIQWALQTQNGRYAGFDKDIAEKMGLVMRYKTNATLKSKYIKTLKEALEHTGDGYIYGIPKLFGTYTGRMTYSNATYKDGPKVSIALHQIPRKAKNVRSLLIAPEGFCIHEDDASGQESRLMALRSGDQTMLSVFANDLNFHGMTGSSIIGMDYYDFMDEYHAQEETGGYYIEQRQLGKLTNLSCNYRIGGKSLSEKALVNYDTFMTEETGRFLVNTFKRTYPGVPDYWKDVIREAKTLGYTEAYGGRRYKIHEWGADSWISESSAINFPIQGGGASMKEIAIAVLFSKIPEAFFCMDMHDATFSYGPITNMQEMSKDILSTLNNIKYEGYWGFVPRIPLVYESALGYSFKDVK